jgi:Tfp pilus assembly protein PilN
VAAARGELAQLEQRTADAERRAAPYSSYDALALASAERVATVKALADQRFDWSATLEALARILPADVQLDKLAGQMTALPAVAPATPPPPPTSGDPAPVAAAPTAPPAPVVSLTGCAPSLARVARLVPRMRLLPGVADVTLGPATVPAPGSDSAGSSSTACSRATFEMSLAFAPPTGPAPMAAATQTAAAPVPDAPVAGEGG